MCVKNYQNWCRFDGSDKTKWEFFWAHSVQSGFANIAVHL